MAASWTFYDSFKKKVVNGSVDLATDSFKVMIASNSYTPAPPTHAFRSDITNEVSGTNYSAGGAALANVALTGPTTGTVTFDADDTAWSNVTFTNGRYGIIYKARGGASSADELVGCADFGANQSPTAQNFSIVWDAAGIFTITG